VPRGITSQLGRREGFSPILSALYALVNGKQEVRFVANKEQKKVQKAAPKSNKQKKEMQKEKKASKSSGGISLKKE
jgi:hypothetical protein